VGRGTCFYWVSHTPTHRGGTFVESEWELNVLCVDKLYMFN